MLPDLITKLLLIFFGYAYPAFECFKTVEKNPIQNPQLRFWCQYWIITTMMHVIERFGYFSSWVPMYGEAKLAFLVYLWFPKTKGSDIVYETFVRPLVMQYEPDMEERFRNLRAKSGEILQFYLKNFTEKGQTLFLDALHHVVSQPLGAAREERMEKQSRSAMVASPIAIRRSPSIRSLFPQSRRVHDETRGAVELTAEELEEDAVVAESLRTARLRWRRSHYYS
ncbi:HVA22-like protein g [Canna indica]|uniref:HVA22-like protein n=1 Tax=Canna indica TaxID=4628 RepID=A0AAQ3KU98_9LILI|nr:HVA22-like protein g [Canna indica]